MVAMGGTFMMVEVTSVCVALGGMPVGEREEKRCNVS